MLLRLIISQVCHLIFIWASEVLTSISLSYFAFSPFCHLSLLSFSLLFFLLLSHHFLPCLSVFLLLCPDTAEARVLQVVFGVRSNEKLPKTRG